MISSALLEFGEYLASSGPGPAAETSRSRLGAAVTNALYERWSGRLLGPGVPISVVTSSLGSPQWAEGQLAGYLLPNWPEYLYVFAYDERGIQVWAGFRRIKLLDPAPGGLAFDPDALARQGVTEEEILAAFGEPREREGWWPSETWTFPDGTVTFRHGIVEGP